MPMRCRTCARIAAVVGAHFLAFEQHPTAIECLERVGAAQQRGFARTRRSDQADDLAAIDGEADIVERLQSVRSACDTLSKARIGLSP